jgi:undecaprenyl-diphosphatase
MRKIAAALAWLGRREQAVLFALLLVAAGSWAFIEIADEMLESETDTLDRRLLLAFRNPANPSDPIGSLFMDEMARDVTALGGVAVLSLLTLAAAGYLALEGKFRMAVFVIASIAVGVAVSNGLKNLYDRPRPNLVPHGSYVYTSSFPSGHSMMAAATYLTLGALLARSQKRKRMKAYLLLLAALVTLAVGISRVYLGVHWPTDVLAGWTAGSVWATICWTVARHMQSTNKLEREDEASPAVAAEDTDA